jgi:hypothetical protein
VARESCVKHIKRDLSWRFSADHVADVTEQSNFSISCLTLRAKRADAGYSVKINGPSLRDPQG